MTTEHGISEELRSILANEMDPRRGLAERALTALGQLRASLENSKGAVERLRSQVAELTTKLRAHENRTHHAEKRANDAWHDARDLESVLLLVEDAIPVEHLTAHRQIEAALDRLDRLGTHRPKTTTPATASAQEGPQK